MKKIVLILTILFAISIGYSQTFVDNFITYNVTSTLPNTVKIVGYNTAGGTSVSIPATVIEPSSNTIYSVTEINSFVFGQKNLTDVMIPNSITSIGLQSFAQNNLTSITIPNSVTSIGDYAFQNNQITNLTIGNGVISIGNGAFRANSPLTCIISTATTPPTITTGGANDSFYSNGDRSNINLSIPFGTASAYAAAQWTGFNSVAAGLSGNFVVDYIEYQIEPTSNNEVTVIDYDNAGGTVVNIPATVNSGCTDFTVLNIGDSAFDNMNLTSVTIPNSVTSIGGQAFRNNLLTNVIIPNSVTYIGEFAFNQNELVSVTISENVTIINLNTFGSNLLTNVTIPNSVTNIGVNAFNSNQLTSIVIPNSVTNLSTGSFEYNELTSVILSENITTIGSNAFNNNLLTNIIIPNSVTTIELGAFQNNNLSAITIPENVTTIGIAAFINNQLTTVTIPSSVTSIGGLAFINNPLTDVYSEGTTPAVISTTGDNYDTFASDRSSIHLHIPGSTAVMEAYVTGAGALWTGFNPVTQDALSTPDFGLVNNIKVITSKNQINISFSNNISLQNYTVYSLSGSKMATGKKNEINTNFLSNGVYIIKLDFDKGTYVKKIIVY